MSQLGLSSFDWPTAAHGASEQSKHSLKILAATVKVSSGYPNTAVGNSCSVTTLRMSTATRPTTTVASAVVLSKKQTTHITVTSTIVSIQTAILIQQTQPPDLRASAIPTYMRTPVLEITAASFDLNTAPPNAFMSASTTSTPIPTTDLSFTVLGSQNPPVIFFSTSAIVGIVIGIITTFCVLIALAILLYRRRRYQKSQSRSLLSKTGKAKSEETMAEKMEHLRELRRQRIAKNVEAFDVLKNKNKQTGNDWDSEEGWLEDEPEKVGVQSDESGLPSRPHRPSGLAMHPPTPWFAPKMSEINLNAP